MSKAFVFASIMVSAALLLTPAAFAVDHKTPTTQTKTAPQSHPPGTNVMSPGDTHAVALTSEECTGLGGTVTTSTACTAAGQKSCQTVDPNGVIRASCIDKVSPQ